MDLLRIITPEEVGEITTKHNGGKFVSLTDLLNERVQNNVYRNFSQPIETESHLGEAKILPFNREIKNEQLENLIPNEEIVESVEINEADLKQSLTKLAQNMADSRKKAESAKHNENENMSSFILIEKARLKKSQQVLKQKEVLELYQKNSNVDVEQLKGQEDNMSLTKESGVLVNKKHY
jgi:hypothetical protein